MERFISVLVVCTFIVGIGSGAIAFLLSPATPFSPLENRPLQQRPTFSWERVFRHQYAEEVETYLSDQFPLRAEWMKVKSLVEQGRGRKEQQGIYRGADDYLIERFDAPSSDQLHRQLNQVDTFRQQPYVDSLQFILVPPSVALYPERLPPFAPTDDVQATQRQVVQTLSPNVFDATLPLQAHRQYSIFYKTDHHWTTYGAYVVYAAFAKSQGWEPIEYVPTVVSSNFYGSYDTRVQGIRRSADEVIRAVEDGEVLVHIADDGTTSSSMYVEEALQQKDQYRYFFGGVHAVMTLQSTVSREVPSLLVIKDSYAHAFLPFLTRHVQTIHVIDLRYYNGSIQAYMDEHDVHDVLLLYNTTQFVESDALYKLNR